MIIFPVGSPIIITLLLSRSMQSSQCPSVVDSLRLSIQLLISQSLFGTSLFTSKLTPLSSTGNRTEMEHATFLADVSWMDVWPGVSSNMKMNARAIQQSIGGSGQFSLLPCQRPGSYASLLYTLETWRGWEWGLSAPLWLFTAHSLPPSSRSLCPDIEAGLINVVDFLRSSYRKVTVPVCSLCKKSWLTRAMCSTEFSAQIA